VTIWIASTLPAGIPATNWIPTPSTAYDMALYPGVSVPTQIRAMIRIYYPTPRSNTQASILPPPDGSMGATSVPRPPERGLVSSETQQDARCSTYLTSGPKFASGDAAHAQPARSPLWR
jgi:hypothetical protein